MPDSSVYVFVERIPWHAMCATNICRMGKWTNELTLTPCPCVIRQALPLGQVGSVHLLAHPASVYQQIRMLFLPFPSAFCEYPSQPLWSPPLWAGAVSQEALRFPQALNAPWYRLKGCVV